MHLSIFFPAVVHSTVIEGAVTGSRTSLIGRPGENR